MEAEAQMKKLREEAEAAKAKIRQQAEEEKRKIEAENKLREEAAKEKIR